MKITPEHLDALKQAQQARKSSSKSPTGFQELLAEETRKAQSAGSSGQGTAPLSRPGSDLYARIQAAGRIEADNHAEPTAMDKMDNVLIRWENYAQLISGSSPDLRQGYRLLESISRELGDLDDSLPESGEAAEQLRPILQEMQILTVTEQVKFNRGDYI